MVGRREVEMVGQARAVIDCVIDIRILRKGQIYWMDRWRHQRRH